MLAVALLLGASLACSTSPKPPPRPDAAADGNSDDGSADSGMADALTDTADVPGDGDADAGDPCPELRFGEELGARLIAGNTGAARDDYSPSCAGADTGPDRVYAFEPPEAGRYVIWVEGDFDAALSVHTDCSPDSPEVACSADVRRRDPVLVLDASAGDVYFLVVDSQARSGGTFWLHVEPLEVCDDGVDNDDDGERDCEELGCAIGPDCIERNCRDGVDNDSDGRTDCDDLDCLDVCIERDCVDGLDQDADGLVDCRDPDCAAAAPCAELDCHDGVDSPHNGLVDCEDPSCVLSCAEHFCADGADDDGDGAVDCEDGDCALERECTEQACADGVDNNDNGAADCDDPGCHLSEACCDAQCPLLDLGSRLGTNLVAGSLNERCDALEEEVCSDRDVRDGPDVAFTFTAAERGTYIFDTLGSTRSITLSLFDTDSCAEATRDRRLACAQGDIEPYPAPFASSATVPLAANQTVLVVLEGNGLTRADYRLSIRAL